MRQIIIDTTENVSHKVLMQPPTLLWFSPQTFLEAGEQLSSVYSLSTRWRIINNQCSCRTINNQYDLLVSRSKWHTGQPKSIYKSSFKKHLKYEEFNNKTAWSNRVAVIKAREKWWKKIADWKWQNKTACLCLLLYRITGVVIILYLMLKCSCNYWQQAYRLFKKPTCDLIKALLYC